MGFYSLMAQLNPALVVGDVKDEYFYQATDTQYFPIGTIFRAGLRSYCYARAGATLNQDVGCKAYGGQLVAYATVAASTVVGATELTIDVGATDGAAADGVLAENELADGYVVVFCHSSLGTMNRRILKNTVVASGGGECTLTLDKGLGSATTVDVSHVECMGSLFRDVRCTNENTSSICGVPVAIATVGQFLWLQTWGPCWVAPQSSVSVGNNHRHVVFRHDGSVDDHDYSDANVTQGQHAGWVCFNAVAGTQGAAFIYLQVCR